MGALSYRHFVTLPARAPCAGRERREVGECDGWEVTGSSCGAGLPALLLALGGGWWLTRRALAPGRRPDPGRRAHQRTSLEPLPRSGNGDELDRLTEVFNAMTARLDGSFQRVREFTLHASHELKTPLTVLRGELETALQDERRAAQSGTAGQPDGRN